MRPRFATEDWWAVWLGLILVGLGLPTAVGKDYPYSGRWAGITPSRTGLYASLSGYLGMTVGWVEGFEINFFGLSRMTARQAVELLVRRGVVYRRPGSGTFVAPSRIDLLSRLAGTRDFAFVWASRVDAKFGDVDAHYLSLNDLIQEKESADRDQDRADLRSLRRVRARRRD